MYAKFFKNMVQEHLYWPEFYEFDYEITIWHEIEQNLLTTTTLPKKH